MLEKDLIHHSVLIGSIVVVGLLATLRVSGQLSCKGCFV